MARRLAPSAGDAEETVDAQLLELQRGHGRLSERPCLATGHRPLAGRHRRREGIVCVALEDMELASATPDAVSCSTVVGACDKVRRA